MLLTEAVHVLLVEDNPGDARLVREMLIEGGGQFRLTRVNCLVGALNELADETLDVLLLDLSLPDTSGLNTLIEVQTLHPDLPVVVLSGLNDETIALEAVHNGAQDYLVKGQINPELLTRALRYAIERKATEQRLAYLAQYDPLTDLPNRVLFRDRLVRALHRAQRHNNLAALMFLDLDHFKDINDTLGHDAGDELLKAVAGRLKGCVRKEDTVARLGGDEFTVLLENINQRDEAATVAQKIIDSLTRPFSFAGSDLFVSASIGIVLFPYADEDAETLIKNADMALYSAKGRGRGIYRFYEPRMNTAVARRLSITTDLRQALDRGEFLLYYQPQFDLAGGELIGLEALLRWRHPQRGLIGPGQFIPMLEESGLIIPVGEWVLRTACAQQRAWSDAGFGPMRLAVNLSARQIRQNQLLKMVKAALADTGVPAEQLQLEVTESMLMANTKETLSTLRGLLDAGIQLSIDDFGTGYSSLNYLRRFPFHALKVDRSFVKDIVAGADGAAIVAAVINLAHSLRLKVVAEGVEGEHELAFLLAEGCDEVQGWLLCEPLPAEDLALRLQNGRDLAAHRSLATG